MALKIGLIGAGGMGSFHARTLAAMGDVELVAIADPFGDAAARLAAEVGGTASLDWRDVITAGIDGLVIASPAEAHEDQALAALAAEIPTLCEKPLGVTAAQCHRIVNAEVADGRRLLQLGLMRVYDPAHVQVAAAMAELGPVHHLRCVHRNVHAVRRSVYGAFTDSMVHDAHTVRGLTGREVARVTAFAAGAPDSIAHGLIVAEYDGGGHATIEFSERSYAYEVSVEVEAELGGVVMALPMRPVLRQDGGRTIDIGNDWFGRFAEAYVIEADAWVASLRVGVVAGPSAWDGLMAQMIVEAGLESIAVGGPVTLDRPPTPSLYIRGSSEVH